MTLSGSLEVFPLEEVLRLLARSRKTGCLRVECTDVSGRVYLTSGSLSLVTTGTDDDFRRHVINAGIVSDGDFRRVETGGATLAEVLIPGTSPALLTDLVREQIVESVYQLRKSGTGEFDFVLDVQPRYLTGQTFDAEVAVSEADRRAAEWSEIVSVLTDLTIPLRMARRLPDENDVTITAPTWRVLATLDGGASVIDLADILGMSRFRTAREVAGLLRLSLVEPVPSAPVHTAPVWEPPAVEVPQPVGRPSWLFTPEPAAAEVAEPEVAEEQAEPGESPVGELTASEPFGSVPSSWMEPEPIADTETDRFLDSVFSTFEDDSTAETEGGFSMGLLRRRRMGGSGRDSDSPEV